MTIAAALAEGKARLAETAGEWGSPALDASLLLAEITGVERSRLPLVDRGELAAEKYSRYRAFIERRAAGEPLAYILGRKEFRGLEFAVSPAVLIPRPDTETLVEAALEYIDMGGRAPSRRKPQEGCALPPVTPPGLLVLDLCTGSGAVAVSLKHERPGLTVYASDISAEALAAARENARRILEAPGRENAEIHFLHSDLFGNFPPELRGAFGLITANPPYIERGALPGLQREVRREPEIALDGGEDGLAVVRRIIAEAPEWLAAGGGLFVEAAPAQMREIAALLEKNGFAGVKTYRDLAGKERVIAAYRAGGRFTGMSRHKK